MNSHANFTYSFPQLKNILIPTMIRSNRFSFITLIACTGSPSPEILLLCDIDLLHIFQSNWNFINEAYCCFKPCCPIQDVALAIWRKADHSACILLLLGVQVYCSMHKEAHWQRSAVMNWCSQDLDHPLINNKLGASIHWWSMFLSLWLIHCMACHLCYIYHRHNQKWKL